LNYKGLEGLAVALVLSGCAVGPNFKPPSAPATEGYTADAVPAQTEATAVDGGAAQQFQLGRDLPGQWWTLFASSRLSALIAEAMANYPDIAAQQAALLAARENVRAQEGVFYPQLQGTGDAAREKVSGATIGPGFPGFITSVYQANVDVSYTFDLFGGERRALEGLQAQVAAQNFKLEASYLTLTTNVASTAIQLASVRDQIAATREIITLEEKQLTVIQRQFELGSQTRADVLQQQSNLASVRATLPPLQQQLAAAEHQLAVLTGHFPRDAGRAEFTLSDLTPGSNTWNIAAGITQPLFEGGTLRAKRRAAIDTYEESSAQYRLVVLQAFQNVADTLTALDNDAQALKAENDALNAAKASLDFIQRQYDDGAANYVALLTAQQTYQQARIASVRALASRYTDTVTLFQALGGGWWNRSDPGALHDAQK
jgi:outer membrane protein TolC